MQSQTNNEDLENQLSITSQNQLDETSRRTDVWCKMNIGGEINSSNITECVICLEEFKDKDSRSVVYNCKHLKHNFCINEWLVNNRHCPLCRVSVNNPYQIPRHFHFYSDRKQAPLQPPPSQMAFRTIRHESNYTSFEVVSAHIWRSWARALNLPWNQTLKLLFSINVRDRVKPSLPSGFYGNAFVLGCAQTSVKDLTEKGLGYTTMLVKRAKERVDSEFVKSVVESVSRGRASPDSVGVLILSQWSRLGLEKVDFGLGKAVHVGPVCCDRYCLLLPVFNQTDAVKAMVAVPASAAHRYEHLVRSFCS
ncbi:hypothetical protein GQ457_09G030590 [Hibiscus cannabinus]